MPQWLQLDLRLGYLPHADYPIRGLIGQANLVSGIVVKGTVTTEIGISQYHNFPANANVTVIIRPSEL